MERARSSCAASKPSTLCTILIFPLYEEAARLNMPIGIHSGIGHFGVNEAMGGEPFRVAKLIVIGGLHSMILNGIPERFPKLRIGAIEVAAQWVRYSAAWRWNRARDVGCVGLPRGIVLVLHFHQEQTLRRRFHASLGAVPGIKKCGEGLGCALLPPDFH